MHKPIEKLKVNENKAVHNSLAQKKSNDTQGFGFVDNRSWVVTQRRLQNIANKSHRNQQLAQLQSMANNYTARQKNATIGIQAHTDTIQLAKVTVRNKTNAYSSGWQQAESMSTGVDDGPKAEAQKVASIAGGSWVGGHMVNDRLGGTGGYSNIVPITSSMNGKHKTIENASRNTVGGGLGSKEVNYHMNILARTDFDFGGGNEVKNMPYRFQQSYEVRDKNNHTGYSNTNGAVLDMFDFTSNQFIHG